MIPPFFPAPSPAAGLLPVPSGTVRADNGCLPPHPLRCGAPKRLHRAPATALSAYRPLSKDCAFGYSSFSLLFLIVLGCTALYWRFFLSILVVPLHTDSLKIPLYTGSLKIRLCRSACPYSASALSLGNTLRQLRTVYCIRLDTLPASAIHTNHT